MSDPISLAIVLALLALVPLTAVMTTSFLKIAIVLSLVRNALGVQQVPPNMALYGLALVLSAYVMAPVIHEVNTAMRDPLASRATHEPSEEAQHKQLIGILQALEAGVVPMQDFMLRNSKPEQRDFFMRTAQRLWGTDRAEGLKENNLFVLVPAFLVSELTAAFQLGFLLYLPFIVIDLIVSNILLAMGMMMVSPVTISMPLKLFLFVMVDGWTRLIQGLVLSYR
ncbi:MULTISPECIES: type III secretion system export apparatus subunit SctR [unclassified Bordetella]|uniref:type III secretion system export apparatus subunit SctR n=1 Tax=unclassified Bordetella TaxID=2630031 RepID=UPI0013233CCE|nr:MULTISPECIES: type III secretion system export apparatus subunit SctR [unclassified Bordetella]MVW70473.1 EscR/YscR/HrcR family type III secretion system export apparatus protein [Bordetella sp. 15P40C-2]MVW78588.1 EscR/YscR/HrcR family type III secretion system export apparatus protein [Bordetella sp. 02P26C-1]